MATGNPIANHPAHCWSQQPAPHQHKYKCSRVCHTDHLLVGYYLHVCDLGHNIADPHPIFLLECDNMQGKAWLKKGCTSSTISHALTCLQATLMFNNDVGYHIVPVNTKSNVIANGISRILSISSLTHEFWLLVSQAPSLTSLWCYLPNAVIIS